MPYRAWDEREVRSTASYGFDLDPTRAAVSSLLQVGSFAKIRDQDDTGAVACPLPAEDPAYSNEALTRGSHALAEPYSHHSSVTRRLDPAGLRGRFDRDAEPVTFTLETLGTQVFREGSADATVFATCTGTEPTTGVRISD